MSNIDAMALKNLPAAQRQTTIYSTYLKVP
jgi:hypothetical protein